MTTWRFDVLDSELVIGLVCSVGTETSLVIDLLQERLGQAGYRVELVKVSSDVIPKLVDIEDPGTDQFKRYSDLKRRETHLVNNKGMTKEQAQQLIERDQAESTALHGQRVNDAFHLADFFVRISESHVRNHLMSS